MLYRILKVFARLAIKIYCRKIIINNRARLREKGPLLLACNHPNSFLDSIIFDTLFEQPIWSLARGDVFKNKTAARILRALKILPVYRTSEGVENLTENYKTFDTCIRLFRENAVVMIFSEGKSINEWHLRALKKGTARLAIKAWEDNIPLRVLPVSINYSSFRRFGKNIFIHFGEIITSQDINMNDPEGARHLAFNHLLRTQLHRLVYEIPINDLQKQQEVLEIKPSAIKKIVLLIPAVFGLLMHAPLYIPVKTYAARRTRYNGHYDSVVTALLYFSYPFYCLLLVALAGILFAWCWALALVIALPLTAWAYVQLKPQLDSL
jgi:1-acyl-sn-glycerol-3-phosphate acyltransferase